MQYRSLPAGAAPVTVAACRRLLPLVLTFVLLWPAAAIAEDVSIASFNIRVFGQTKVGKPELRAYLAEIVRKFDIVAIQEIKDVSQRTPAVFLDEVNSTGRNYDYLLSPRTGQEPDDQDSQEQYAYYFDEDRIEPVGEDGLFDDSAEDLFQREPYTARFRVKGTPCTLTVTSIHTRPESAVDEIAGLHTVYLDLLQRYPEENHHLILGDFNAGCDYASPAELDTLEIRGAEYHWIVPDSADTNVSPGTACAYDRLVANQALSTHFKLWGIANWFTNGAVSDHWPVWVAFTTAHP
jgi:endonuclease/exonuclease/phosphatase family metal-dependent hydrolase